MKHKILKDTFYLNTASVVAQIFAILQTIIIMRFLNPESYGVWLGLLILLTYGAYANLGIEYGIGVRLPYYQGQQNKERELQIQDTAYLSWSMLSLVLAMGVFCYAFGIAHRTNLIRWGLVVIGLMILSEQQVSFLSRWQTSSLKDFRMTSSLSIARSLISFLVLVPLGYYYNVFGVMIGALLVSVIMMICWKVKTSYRFQRKLSIDAFRELIKVGSPILIVVVGGVLISTLDRVLILQFLGATSLGYYGVVSMGGSALYGLLGQAGGAMGPHMIEDMGKHNNYAPSLEKYLVKPTIAFAYAITILISLLILVLPPFVEIVLEKYVPGLFAFYIYVPSFFFLSIILTANNIINVILIALKKQRYAVYIQAIAIIIQISCGILFISLEWGIVGVAFASFLAFAFYGLSILLLAAKYVLIENRKVLALILEVLAPFIYAVFMILIIQWIGHQWFPISPLIRGSVMLFLWGVALIPMFYVLNKRLSIISEVMPLFSTLRQRISLFIRKHKLI